MWPRPPALWCDDPRDEQRAPGMGSSIGGGGGDARVAFPHPSMYQGVPAELFCPNSNCRRVNQCGSTGRVHRRFWDENPQPHRRSGIKHM